MRARPLIVVIAVALAGPALAGCGGDRSGLLPSDDASRLQADLDNLASVVSAGDCEQVSAALRRLQDDLVQIPSSVDVELRNRIQEGAVALVRQAPEACSEAQTTRETPTDTTTTETTTTETDTTDTETTTTETDTTPTETTPTETAPTDTTTTETVPPPPEGTGGAGAPGGTP